MHTEQKTTAIDITKQFIAACEKQLAEHKEALRSLLLRHQPNMVPYVADMQILYVRPATEAPREFTNAKQATTATVNTAQVVTDYPDELYAYLSSSALPEELVPYSLKGATLVG